MGQQQINQYALERTTFGDNDYYDIDYYNGSTYQSAKIKGSVIKAGASGIGLFSQTADGATITNTTTETSLLGSGVGSLLVTANTFAVGSSYVLKVCGNIGCLNNSDIVLNVKSGSVVLATTGTIQLPQINAQTFELELNFTIRQIGVSGVADIVTNGELSYIQHSSTDLQGHNFLSQNNTTFDTTANNTLDVTWAWASASASNTVNSVVTNLRRTY
tara:strand:- start:7114 stop:7764 length:651 start_codon:yes stop_codon:yes gene_type:complete